MSTRDIMQKAIDDYDREYPPETLYDRRLREKREAREAEAREWSDRLARDAKHRETRLAAADNAAAWDAWFADALYRELRKGNKSAAAGGLVEFVCTLRNRLRDELRREFGDRQQVLEARCAALERRLESVAQGRREKFVFAHERDGTVAGPSFPPGRKFVMKH